MSCLPNPASSSPAGAPGYPRLVFNLPGRTRLAYRNGDFNDLRTALLQARPGETQLSQTLDGVVQAIWRPHDGSGDLALQLVEWWALIGDVLTFYNEEFANNAYLATTQRPDNIRNLVQLIGYRPRPGIGATVALGGLLSGTQPVTLAPGFQVQSKPSGGAAPQVFELDQTTVVNHPDAITVQPAPVPVSANPGTALAAAGAAPSALAPSATTTTQAQLLSEDGTQVWLTGTVSGIKPEDRLLLVDRRSPLNYAWAVVAGTQPGTDPVGKRITIVTFRTAVRFATDPAPAAADYRLLRSTASARPWSFAGVPATGVITSQGIDLATLARPLVAGDLVLFELRKFAPPPPGVAGAAGQGLLLGPGSPPELIDVYGAPAAVFEQAPDPNDGNTVTTVLVPLDNYAELIWYANGQGPVAPTASPPGSPDPVPIPVLHSHLDFVQTLPTDWNSDLGGLTLRFGWVPAGELVPVVSAATLVLDASARMVQTTGAAPFPAGTGMPVLLLDPNGQGATAIGHVDAASPNQLTLSSVQSLPAAGLAAPQTVLFNPLAMSRGKTIAGEVLGSGNASFANQDFVLQKTPVTYLKDPTSRSGSNYSSTVQITVDGQAWQEVPTLHGQAATARVFVTSEDEQGNTHVTFGDGRNGARLPNGTNNVLATYRIGSGAAVPDAGTLTVVLKPQTGLKGVANPVAPAGGADPDGPDKIRADGPQSILALGRAVTLADFQSIAANTLGVLRPTAEYIVDRSSRRTRLVVWVRSATDVAAVQAALAGRYDPSRPVTVGVARAVPITLALTLSYDPAVGLKRVDAALRSALLDPDSGLLGSHVIGIGAALFDSEIVNACLAVPGVLAVKQLVVALAASSSSALASPCMPGSGRYFSVADDAQDLILTWQAGS